MNTDKQITEQLLYKKADELYRNIEAYIKTYPVYIEVEDELVRLKWQLQELLFKREGLF